MESTITNSRPAESASSPRSTTSRNSRCSPTPTPPSTARALDRPFWSRRNREPIDFHGSLFEFVRNTDLDAKGDFDTTTPKFNLNQFGGSVGGPILHNKTFFFVDGEQKYQREGITFTGLVPSLAMRNGDFSADPFGNPVSGLAIANPNMIGASTSPTTYPNVYFQCDSSGNPMPANADGSQAQGAPCNKIPSNLINSAGQGLINIYPAPNVNRQGELQLRQRACPHPERNQIRCSAGRDAHRLGQSCLPASATTRRSLLRPAARPTLAEANAFGSNENLINHARNIGIGWSHVFSATTLNQATFGYDRIFDYIDSLDNFTCGSALTGHSQCRSGLLIQRYPTCRRLLQSRTGFR